VPGLPSGTVTFLFTDIEGSTRLLQELGAGYADLLEAHERVVRYALSGNDGVEVDTQGDAFFAAFASARDAVAAAEEIQRGLSETATRVRIGLHTGEAELRGARYVGLDVHRAARICSAAHGGQVLMSQLTRDLADADARDLGEHRLKDLLAPQRLFQLVVPGLPDDFPPPQTLERWRTTLPVQATPLVGRERELAEARVLLARGGRLLTLTGPGGAGKTRLALQLAADSVDAFEDGVFFVDLSALRDVELVLPTVAQAVGVRDAGGQAAGARLMDALADSKILIVVDSVEQVVDSAPEVGRLLASCPGLEIVATSRAALRLTGEQEYPVPPLPEDEAVELFTERARAVRPGFELNGDRHAVAEICARLDGLPLAIELAAARVKLLPPPKLLARLDQSLSLLTGGARDAPERHQTLRATIDWSYELLEEDERALLARLSVFAGGFTLDAAESVCDASFDGLASLVEKSLVSERETEDGEPRFALLETVREYARERLEALGEVDAVSERHAGHVLALVEEIGRMDTPNEGLLTPVAREFENVRAARAWFDRSGDVDRGLRLAVGAFWSMWKLGGVAEMEGWITDFLERAEQADIATRADAHGVASLTATFRADNDASRRHAEASLTLARELDDVRRIEWALRTTSFSEEDPEERLRILRECEALLQGTSDVPPRAWIKVMMAGAYELEGEFDQAYALVHEAVRMFEGAGFRWEATNARIYGASALYASGRHTEVAPVAVEALRESAALGAQGSIAEALGLLAGVRVESDAAVGTRLAAATHSLLERERLVPDAGIRTALADAERVGRESLGDAYEAEAAAGRALSVDEAVELALEP
jgi:predicted ATPase/class 3 adenylate cyclase